MMHLRDRTQAAISIEQHVRVPLRPRHRACRALRQPRHRYLDLVEQHDFNELDREPPGEVLKFVDEPRPAQELGTTTSRPSPRTTWAIVSATRRAISPASSG